MASLLLVSALALSACGKSLSENAKIASKKMGVPITVLASNDDKCASEQFSQIYKDYKNLSKDQQGDIRAKLQNYKGLTVNATVTTGTRTGELNYLMLVQTSCSSYRMGGRYYGRGYGGGFYGRGGYPYYNNRRGYGGFWDPNYDIGSFSNWDNLGWYPSVAYSCSSTMGSTKLIGDHTQINGTLPATQVAANSGKDGAILEITTQNLNDQTVQRNFITYWWSAYNRIDNQGDADFMDGQARGFIRTTYERVYERKESCGKLARLSEIMAAAGLSQELAKSEQPIVPEYEADLSAL